ncbi:hypothetical protein D5018_09390 [Parashewanella curva]|uniref:Uncharacterized protein n=1 Tax=Parashewanella curva TaxID=2338552 RepID=A0A3L8PZP4_9GAMM|nr:hypothetical protein [Parashewanella curva]RLV60008.1 hypothetical protein D5018_09390 [Parashewanella curva]
MKLPWFALCTEPKYFFVEFKQLFRSQTVNFFDPHVEFKNDRCLLLPCLGELNLASFNKAHCHSVYPIGMCFRYTVKAHGREMNCGGFAHHDCGHADETIKNTHYLTYEEKLFQQNTVSMFYQKERLINQNVSFTALEQLIFFLVHENKDGRILSLKNCSYLQGVYQALADEIELDSQAIEIAITFLLRFFLLIKTMKLATYVVNVCLIPESKIKEQQYVQANLKSLFQIGEVGVTDFVNLYSGCHTIRTLPNFMMLLTFLYNPNSFENLPKAVIDFCYFLNQPINFDEFVRAEQREELIKPRYVECYAEFNGIDQENKWDFALRKVKKSTLGAIVTIW